MKNIVFTSHVISYLAAAAATAGNPLYHEEHTAIIVEPNTVGDAIKTYEAQGWKCIKEIRHNTGGQIITAFMQHGTNPELRIEFVSVNGPLNHKAIRVLSRKGYEEMVSTLKLTPLRHLPKETINTDTIQAEMFETEDGVLQILWRKDPLFPGDPDSVE
jgi:hypothetical protein